MDIVEEELMEKADILRSSARLPDHVVYRTFVYETVVLNLQTGKYHGLNRTGGRMLELLEREPTVEMPRRRSRSSSDVHCRGRGRPVRLQLGSRSRGLIVLTR